MRLLLAFILSVFITSAYAQSAPKHILTTASTNCSLVNAGKTILRNVVPGNTTATIYYLKFYDKATAPVAATDTPVLTIPLTASASPLNPIGSVDGFSFLNGMGICVTGAITDNDNTNAAAGVVINIGVSAN